jgi:cell division septal protein FtsQ
MKGVALMQLPMIANAKHTEHPDVIESMRCAVVVKPTQAEKHKKEMLRYLVLVIALLAVLVLITIVLYYTQSNSVPIEHVGSLASHLALCA